ncbi:MAG: hypothetical protein WBA38_03325 [Gordonia sp. (in: high G+C Gram-positive bacteria)]|uniref:hypothetical protein n=1 Tax=Gordonia sp. (in: high G+C Gram-positive bacteria) TaxID=84139 RepID=UPI003C78EEE4
MAKQRFAVAACAVVLGAVSLTGCSSNDGSPVKADGSASTTSTTTSSSTSSSTTVPDPTFTPIPPPANAPANALTMTCAEFMTLDEATQTAVGGAIIAGGKTKIHPNNQGIAGTLAKLMCSTDPNQTVSQALGATPK